MDTVDCGKQWILSSCGVRASHCSGLSCSRAQALGHVGSAVVAHKLSCPAACEIFQDQQSNLCSLHWQMDSSPLDHQQSPNIYIHIYIYIFFLM